MAMFCDNCGQQFKEPAFRCPACRHLPTTSWLILFIAAAWLAIVALNFAFFVGVVPLVADLFAGLGMFAMPALLLNFSWAFNLQHYGILIFPLLLVAARYLPKLGKFPKVCRGVAVASFIALVLMTAIIAADGRYLSQVTSMFVKSEEQTELRESELKARDSTRSIVVAEYRYRELHPKNGFTCEMDSLEPLGGPKQGDDRNWNAFHPNMRAVDVYTIRLGACREIPVTSYELATTPDPSFGSKFAKAEAYCSDSSGILYFAQDGKPDTCLSSRTPYRERH